jgi:hypothetical protein
MVFLARVIVWSCRLLIFAVALWWPGLWRDPIYTPRQIRLAGHVLTLPNGTVAVTPEERALAIFWMWEHRTLVTTRWLIGPYRGLRNPQGWVQTLSVMVAIWSVGSGIIWLLAWLSPHSFPRSRRGKGRLLVVLTTCLRRFLARQPETRLSL